MTKGKKIKSITKIENIGTKVYDIEVRDAHHYILEDGTVSHNSYVPTKEMGGGSGLKYSASSIVFLSKKKLKENKEQTGVLITAEMVKSRLSREGSKVEIHLDFEEGLDKYYGLVDFACAAGVWQKSGSRIKVGEKSYYASEIYKNVDQFFTEEVLNELDEFSKKVFQYGGKHIDTFIDEEES